MSQSKWNIELFIKRNAEDVKAWWTDLPEDYIASDPEEVPFRIVTTKKSQNHRELLTYWHAQGSIDVRHEVLELKPDGGWIIEMTDDPKFHFRNEYIPKTERNGTTLTIQQTVTPKDPSYAQWLPDVKNEMEQIFKRMVKICERDAPQI